MSGQRPQPPSVGRIVHYVSYGTPGGEYGKECRAAIITEVSSRDCDTAPVGLAVLNPTGMFFNAHVHYHEAPLSGGEVPDGGALNPGGTWHWPERVDAPTTTSGEAYTTSAGAYELTPSSIDPDELERLKSSGHTYDAHAKLDEIVGENARRGYRVIPDPDRRHDLAAQLPDEGAELAQKYDDAERRAWYAPDAN